MFPTRFPLTRFTFFDPHDGLSDAVSSADFFQTQGAESSSSTQASIDQFGQNGNDGDIVPPLQLGTVSTTSAAVIENASPAHQFAIQFSAGHDGWSATDVPAPISNISANSFVLASDFSPAWSPAPAQPVAPSPINIATVEVGSANDFFPFAKRSFRHHGADWRRQSRSRPFRSLPIIW